jgi:hypothetical protein
MVITNSAIQMLVIAFHEFGHAIVACCTGGRVESISLDPHEGGVSRKSMKENGYM